MRAALLHEHGAVPELGDVPDPDGPAVGRVLAAGLNPIDLRTASGALGARPLPYVVGTEAVVEHEGRRLYVTPAATFAERVAFDPDEAIPVPAEVDDATALAYGVAGMAAWLALERGRPAAGESVLVLGASGVVGLVAVQAARAMGAGRIVAAARSEAGLARARKRGADATVRLGAEELAAAGPYDVVIDPLWGAPAAEALQALRPGGRLVQLGQSAGAEATLPSGPIRFRQLEILGHTNFANDVEARRRAFEGLCAARVRVEAETLPLARVAEAWSRQAAGPSVKLVLAP